MCILRILQKRLLSFPNKQKGTKRLRDTAAAEPQGEEKQKKAKQKSALYSDFLGSGHSKRPRFNFVQVGGGNAFRSRGQSPERAARKVVTRHHRNRPHGGPVASLILSKWKHEFARNRLAQEQLQPPPCTAQLSEP